MVTGKMHESWLQMLMGGDGEAIGVEGPRGATRQQRGSGSGQ